jgi:hypothetical protein
MSNWRARPRKFSEVSEIELSPRSLQIEISVERIRSSMEIEIPPENSTTDIQIEISPNLDMDEQRFSARTPSITSSLTSMDFNGIHFPTFLEEVNYLSESAGNSNAKPAGNSNAKPAGNSNSNVKSHLQAA